MKYAFVSLLALLISISSLSQRGKEYFLVDSVNYDSLPAGDRALLDSLLPVYHAAKNDTTKLKILVSFAEGLSDETLWPRYNDLLNKKAEQLLKNSRSLSREEILSVKKSYAMSLQDKGYYEQNFNANIPVSLVYYNSCRKIQEEIGDKKGLANTLNNIGISHYQKGDISKAIEYYMTSVKIQEDIKDGLGLAYTLGNLASTYLEQGDTAKAIEYQLRSLKLREGGGDKHGLGISLSQLANFLSLHHEDEKALIYFRRSVKLWEELGERQGLSFCMQYLGRIYQQEGEKLKREGKPIPDTLFPKALEFMLKSLKISEDLGDKRSMTIVLTMIGNHFLFENNDLEALKYGLRSLKISKEIGHPVNIRSASRLLYSVYKQQENWEEALHMHELTIHMRDSIFNIDTKKSTIKKQLAYEYEKQEAIKNGEHQKELAVAEEGKKRQRIISYGVGLGLLMMTLFAIFIFNRLQITRKQKLIIEEQKKTVEQKNKHITDSINYAKRIQDAILPSKEELSKCFSDYFVFFQPKDIVSGDFYWLSRHNDKTILAVADCTGHGVPGAFMSMIGNTLLNEIVNEQKIFQPSEILNHLNEGIVHALHHESRSQDDGMDISICLFEENKVTFAGANHSLYIAEEGALRMISGDVFSIGGVFGGKNVSFSQHEINMEGATYVYLSSDGFAGQRGGEAGKLFGTKRLEELFASIAGVGAEEQQRIIHTKLNSWAGAYGQTDDVLVAGIKL